MKTKQDLVKALMVMANYYEKNITPDMATMILDDLKDYPIDEVIDALKLCRMELNRFPTISDIIKRTNPKSEASQAQEIVENIFTTISYHGQYNPDAARYALGEHGWKTVMLMGGWIRVCSTPADDTTTLRAQLKRAAETVVEDKIRHGAISSGYQIAGPQKQGMHKISFEGLFEQLTDE